MSRCIKELIQNLNLIIGCDIGCNYCYARGLTNRYHITEDFSVPEYYPEKLRIMARKKPRNLFLTGMSDFAGWDEKWRDEIFTPAMNDYTSGKTTAEQFAQTLQQKTNIFLKE